MKKLLSLMLALLMLGTVLISCSSGDEDESIPFEEQTTVGDDGLVYDANGYLVDKVGKQDFGGKEIVICGWSEVAKRVPEYDVEALDGDIVSEAAYKRNLAVKTRLNVKLRYELLGGHTGSGGGQAQLERVQNAAGTNEINLIATYSWNPATYLVNGFLGNMSSLPHLDLESPWWNQSVLEKNSVYGKVYFATGDIAPSYIGVTYGMFFNKKIVSEYHLEDPYELYDKGEWTLENMIALSKKVGEDVDGFGTKNTGDKFGFATSHVPLDAFLQGSGVLTVENEADGSLKVGEDFGSEKAQSLLETMVNFNKTEACLFSSTTDTLFEDSWVAGDVLFILEEFDSVKDWVIAGMDSFGVLPMPKYDENQTEYYTIPGFYHTVWCVPIAMASDESTGAVLEVMASESYRNVTPAYFENLFQKRFSDDYREAEMFGAIKDSVVIDAGRLFQSQLNSDTWMPYRNAMFSGSTSWMSAYKGFKDMLKERIGRVNEFIAGLEK